MILTAMAVVGFYKVNESSDGRYLDQRRFCVLSPGRSGWQDPNPLKSVRLTRACLIPVKTFGRFKMASRCCALPNAILYNTNSAWWRIRAAVSQGAASSSRSDLLVPDSRSLAYLNPVGSIQVFRPHRPLPGSCRFR